MKSITIKGSERESVGKKATKAVRNAGMVPCVIYGGDQPVHFSADERAFKNLVYTPNAHTVVIELEREKSSMQFYKTFSFTQFQTKFYTLISFNYMMTKKSLWKFL